VKKLRVNTPSEVRQQIREQVLYIARDSVDNALAWEDRPAAAIDGLADFHGHAIDEEASKRLAYSVRKLVFERTYLVHYRVDDAASEVRVVRVRHGARLPKADEP
jgi:plasmid stabilization system protein ParE